MGSPLPWRTQPFPNESGMTPGLHSPHSPHRPKPAPPATVLCHFCTDITTTSSTENANLSRSPVSRSPNTRSTRPPQRPLCSALIAARPSPTSVPTPGKRTAKPRLRSREHSTHIHKRPRNVLRLPHNHGISPALLPTKDREVG